MRHLGFHCTEHIGWLRADVPGANDGLISTSSLVAGVAAAQTAQDRVLLAAPAGLVAGALMPLLVLKGTAARLGGASIVTGAACVAF